MDKKIYLFAAIAVLLVGAGVYFSFSSPAATGAGKLEASHLNYDFGQLFMKNGKVSHEFVLRNSSGQAVTLGEISTSCMCTAAYLEYNGKEIGPFGMGGMSSPGSLTVAGTTIDPGKEAVIKAIFDPAAHGPAGAGHVERIIYIDTDSQVQPKLQFQFSAEVNL
jgi:hypothetical protein